MKLTKKIEDNILFLRNRYGIEKTFDIIDRKILVGNTVFYFLMIDGFAKDEIMLYVIERLQNIKIDKIDGDISTFVKKNIAYIEAEVTDDFNKIEGMFLSGAIVILIDGEENALIIDARSYPVRSINEPDLEKVTRGPRDGFVETLIFNTALVRRRVKDHSLRFEIKEVGTRSKTNIAVTYIDDLVDKGLLQNILKKIDSIKIESLVMAEKSLSEKLIKHTWYNPIPQVRYTERPDVAASHLLEGHILIMVDTTPSVIIMPTTIFHFTQHAEDYYQTPIVGTYIRQIRFIALFMSYILVPLWYLLVSQNHNLFFTEYFTNVKEFGNTPLIVQLLILEFSLDLLKISSIHTPSSLNTSLGIIGGLILGNFAVTSGWLIPEAILILSLTGIASFATPSIEFSWAIRIFRLFLLIMTFLFKLPGFIIANLIVLIIIFTTNNGSKMRFTYPLIPFNFKHLKHLLWRFSIPSNKK